MHKTGHVHFDIALRFLGWKLGDIGICSVRNMFENGLNHTHKMQIVVYWLDKYKYIYVYIYI